MKDDAQLLAYITFPSKEEAKVIAKQLILKRLVASSNIITQVESSYWWENDIVRDNEVIGIFKTIAKQRASIIKLVNEEHSYEVPCVIFMAIQDGNPEFLHWIKEVIEK